MTYEVKVMVGAPASGKSTFVKNTVYDFEEGHLTTCVISRDYIRKSFLRPGERYFDREDEVFKEFIRQINEAMELGINVVFVDATHISRASRNKLLKNIKADKNITLTFEVMDTCAATCLTRNSEREGIARVPNSEIRSMIKHFEIPTMEEVPVDKWGFKDVFINIHYERKG